MNAVTTNTAESTDTSSSVSATAMMDISGSSDHASPVEPIRPTTVSSASAMSVTTEMPMETASNPTSRPTATTIKDTTLNSKLASVLRDRSS